MKTLTKVLTLALALLPGVTQAAADLAVEIATNAYTVTVDREWYEFVPGQNPMLCRDITLNVLNTNATKYGDTSYTIKGTNFGISQVYFVSPMVNSNNTIVLAVPSFDRTCIWTTYATNTGLVGGHMGGGHAPQAIIGSCTNLGGGNQYRFTIKGSRWY